ncbi:zinc ribbon domain-containing protein [Nostoc sp.]|uniref:zinc ribbon domain-containing protein n=1 Tax=Nostoc sp. TaxID=1180 RepID=UPI002FFB1094
MATVSCPRCHQLVDSQAISCPYCRTTLKAYGHPGIPLHRATGDGYLCDTCTYHADDTCNFPQRPYAKNCTLYQNIEETKLEFQQQRYTKGFAVTVKTWVKRNQALLLLLALLLVCLLFVILRS